MIMNEGNKNGENQMINAFVESEYIKYLGTSQSNFLDKRPLVPLLPLLGPFF
jgi:hypothetical protein